MSWNTAWWSQLQLGGGCKGLAMSPCQAKGADSQNSCVVLGGTGRNPLWNNDVRIEGQRSLTAG